MAVKTSHPLVSIVILNWNGLEDTKLCLEYAKKLDYPNYEIIVVDNGSSADQKEYLRGLTGITYIDNQKNRGFAGGQIDGYRCSNGEYILLLNNDAVIQSDYLKEAMPLFDDPTVAVVGGRSYFWNDDEQVFDDSNRFYSYMTIDPVTAETTLNMSDYGTVQEVNVVSGSAVIVRKSVAEKLGYLWEPFFAYYEETDLFARYKRAGYKILFNPRLHIWHKNGASSGAQGGSFFFYYHIFRNRYMFAVRNFDDKYLALFKKQYDSLARRAIRESAFGSDQRRIAKAYILAKKYHMSHKSELLKARSEFKERFSGSYSDKIIAEQTAVSLVVDAGHSSKSELKKLYSRFASDTNPLHEYVIVTNDSHSIKETSKNVRFIENRQYFETHPINLGCLAARYDWIVVTDIKSIPEVDECINRIVDSYIESPSAIDVTDNTLILTKKLYTQSGGFQEGTDSLKSNLVAMRHYAYIDGGLIQASNSINLTDSQIAGIKTRIDIDKKLYGAQSTTRWQVALSRYYRLQQLTYLTKWISHPKIPLRLKMGRSKNLFLAGATFDKKRLATELKHMRNEVLLNGNKQKVVKMLENQQIKSDGYSRKQLSSISNIPVFIVCFERVRELSKLIIKLEKMGLKKIVLIDNDSTYQPLLDYFEETPHQVLKLGRNIGHTAPWSLGIIRSLVPYGYYIVTDPDVLPVDECINKKPVEHLVELHQKYPAYQKVGFGLKIDDLPDHYPLKKDVIAWEGQFWEQEVERNVYEAGVDTTFALYKPGTFVYTLHPSLRTGEPYIARHMPWYTNPSKPDSEDTYYKTRANTNVTSWNVDELPERYQKEMRNGK